MTDTTMPKLSSTQYAQALFDSIQEVNPKDHDLVIDNFANILAQNGDLGKIEDIEAEFKRIEMKEKGIKEMNVTVARTTDISHEIIHELNKIAGTKIEIKKKVDEGIVGGMVIRVDDTLIDASVKGQLESLNKSLKS
jgi:F-type H+-transporting ATPase subunit delta